MDIPVSPVAGPRFSVLNRKRPVGHKKIESVVRDFPLRGNGRYLRINRVSIGTLLHAGKKFHTHASAVGNVAEIDSSVINWLSARY